MSDDNELLKSYKTRFDSFLKLKSFAGNIFVEMKNINIEMIYFFTLR